MLKKRIIFKLHYSDNNFCLSRNFRLQKVGNEEWLINKLKFNNFSNYLDEIIILNINKKKNESFTKFLNTVKNLLKKTFIPVTLGGGLKDFDQIKKCFEVGADKVLITSEIKNKKFIKKIIDHYGSQALICGVDVRKNDGKFYSYLNNGTLKFLEINKHLLLAKKLKFGEILINSIDNDGTGMGFLNPKLIKKGTDLPIILSGGAGNSCHFELLKNDKISALATGNLFNFIGEGLLNLRKDLLKKGINIKSITSNE